MINPNCNYKFYTVLVIALIGMAILFWTAVAETPTKMIADVLGARIVSYITQAVASSERNFSREPREPIAGIVYNLIKNPSFEDPDPDYPDRPAGFSAKTVEPGNSKNIRFTWESPGYRSDKCIAIDALDVYLGYWETIVPVKPRKQYLISFRYKCGKGLPGSIKDIYNRLRNLRPGGPNIELGVVSNNKIHSGKAKHWSDTTEPLEPIGGIYLPVATDWASFTQIVETTVNQKYMSLKLRMYCSIQKVWFDDLTVIELDELPKIELVSPSPNAVLYGNQVQLEWKNPREGSAYFIEYSRSPIYVMDRTQRFKVLSSRLTLTEPLQEGLWFWRVGVAEQHGLPVWVAEGRFHVGNPQWVESDTTPPMVNLPSPVPNQKVPADTVIKAHFSDTGSGVDVKSARIILDGKDVTGQAEVTEKGFLYKPATPLTPGAHEVEVYVSDKAANRSNRLSWRFGVDQELQYSLQTKDRKVFLNDKPYFPIGINNYRCHPGDRRFDERHLAAVSAAGVDVLLNTIPPGLDMLHKYGMKSLLNITCDLKQILKDGWAAEAAEKNLFAAGDPNKGQAQFKNHPTVIGYWADDPENLENTDGTPTPTATLMILNAVRDVLKKSDPDRPLVWAISNLPRLRDSGQSADILLAYRYPVPHYHPKVIDDYTLRYVYTVFPQKPIFFNSQALDLGMFDMQYSDPKGMRPTVAEMRAMAYYAIVFGISGYTFYANYLNDKETPEHWAALLRTASELRYLAPILSEGRTFNTVSLWSDSTSSSIYFREIEYDGTHILIAVNMSGGRVDATWEFYKSKQVVKLFEDRVLNSPTAQMRDIFAPFEVHVYQWRD